MGAEERLLRMRISRLSNQISSTPTSGQTTPPGFVFTSGKLYWTGGPIKPSLWIPDGKKLYVDSVTGEMVIQ